MENNYEIILTDFETGAVKLSNKSDLNNIFTFNFDFLKGILETIIKNQISLQKQFEEKSNSHDKNIEILNNKFIEFNNIKQKEINSFSLEELTKVNNRLDKLEKNIGQINEELDKSK